MLSTIAETVSIMEELPESSRRKILVFAQNELKVSNPNNPFVPLTKERVMADIRLSEEQIDAGKGIDATEAVMALRKKYGFA